MFFIYDKHFSFIQIHVVYRVRYRLPHSLVVVEKIQISVGDRRLITNDFNPGPHQDDTKGLVKKKKRIFYDFLELMNFRTWNSRVFKYYYAILRNTACILYYYNILYVRW